MLDKKPLKNILFLDIETTSQYPAMADMPEKQRELFMQRFRSEFEGKEVTQEYAEQVYSNKAPLFAEFGKIICISALRIVEMKDGACSFKTISIYSKDEKELLNSFLSKFKTISLPIKKSEITDFICSHNGFVFDWPFISKRLLINGINLPYMLDFAEQKPWDLDYFIDTKTLWKFGSYDNNTSLDLLCYSLGIESPKSDMSGDKVKDVFWKEDGLERIAKYCEQDVLSLAKCATKMKGLNLNFIKSK